MNRDAPLRITRYALRITNYASRIPTAMRTRTLLVPLFWLLGAVPAGAQMPLHPPEIRTIFPLGGVQGSTVEVLVEGQNVSGPSAVAISGEGVRASVVAEAGATAARIVGASTARVRFEIAPDAPV